MAKQLLYIPTVSRKNRLPVYLQIKPTSAPEKILILSGRQWLQEKEKRKREGKKGESKVKKKIRFFFKKENYKKKKKLKKKGKERQKKGLQRPEYQIIPVLNKSSNLLLMSKL